MPWPFVRLKSQQELFASASLCIAKSGRVVLSAAGKPCCILCCHSYTCSACTVGVANEQILTCSVLGNTVANAVHVLRLLVLAYAYILYSEQSASQCLYMTYPCLL